MTNEEAIKALKRIRKDWQFTYSYDCEAVEMAIQTLTAISELSQSLKAVNRYEMDEKVLMGFNMAVAIFNEYFGEIGALKNEQTDGDLISRKAVNKLRKYNLVGGIHIVSLDDINKLPSVEKKAEDIINKLKGE